MKNPTLDAQFKSAPRLLCPRTLGALALSASLLATSPCIALANETGEVIEGRSGTTRVTVVATDGNLKFRVPTVIPFVADYDGTLQGPSAETTYIENLSAFAIKVTNVKVNAENGWSHTEDLTAQDNSVSWAIGPSDYMVSASGATSEAGISISNASWNMSYGGAASDADKIFLATGGEVQKVTKDISSAVQIGTVTFTVAPGIHASDANVIDNSSPDAEDDYLDEDTDFGNEDLGDDKYLDGDYVDEGDYAGEDSSLDEEEE